MNIGFIIQARMGSTRFPEKILRPFHGNDTMIDIILNRLHQATNEKIIVATTTRERDDVLANHLIDKNELVYRGSENDVLDRFIQAAEAFDLEGIVRICSDNPFLDPNGVVALIDKARNSKADYIGFKINGLPSIKTHFGFWGEYVTLEALKKVAVSTKDSQAHEHVTIHVYSHPETFHCEWVDCPDFIQGRNDIRLTVDTQEDFSNTQRVYSDLVKTYPNFGLQEIVNYIDQHDELKSSMKRIIKQNAK